MEGKQVVFYVLLSLVIASLVGVVYLQHNIQGKLQQKYDKQFNETIKWQGKYLNEFKHFNETCWFSIEDNYGYGLQIPLFNTSIGERVPKCVILKEVCETSPLGCEVTNNSKGEFVCDCKVIRLTNHSTQEQYLPQIVIN